MSGISVSGTVPAPAAELPSAQTSPADLPAVDCPSCGAAIPALYCTRCGERRVLPGDAALGRFFREAAEEVAGLDSRVMRTLRALVLRPGVLTAEYLAGRRKPYISPLRLYLAAFALTMLIVALVPEAAPRTGSDGGFSRQLQQVVERVYGAVAAARGVAPARAKELLNDTTMAHLQWLSAVLPLVFGVFVHAMFFRRRRWFTENLVFATHFAAFNYVVGMALMPVQLGLGVGAMVAASSVVFLVMLVYVAKAVRRVYGGGRWGAAWRTVVLMIAFSISQLVTGCLALATATLWLVYF